MKQGCYIPTLSHKDFDFHASFGTIGDRPEKFPQEYDTDFGVFGLRDQNADGQPYGCTNYSQAALATDLTGKKRDPEQLESLTHANVRGGYSVRDSLDAARTLGWFNWYFNIQAYAPLDYFDTMRYAQLIGAPEVRSITVGWPWFPSWQNAINAGKQVMEMPTDAELIAVRTYASSLNWHNAELTGWKQVNGSPMYKCKSWQGKRDPIYFPREVVNVVMNLKYTVAYTPTMLAAPNIMRIPLSILDTLRSFIRNFPQPWRY